MKDYLKALLSDQVCAHVAFTSIWFINAVAAIAEVFLMQQLSHDIYIYSVHFSLTLPEKYYFTIYLSEVIVWGGKT